MRTYMICVRIVVGVFHIKTTLMRKMNSCAKYATFYSRDTFCY